jgi:hypothetical protein
MCITTQSLLISWDPFPLVEPHSAPARQAFCSTRILAVVVADDEAAEICRRHDTSPNSRAFSSDSSAARAIIQS